MESLQNQRAFFFAICNGPKEQHLRRQLLKPMSREQVHAFCELALNILYGAVPLSHEKRKLLRPLKPFLRSLSQLDNGPIVRKKIILSHIPETFFIIQTVFKAIDKLVWIRDGAKRGVK